MLKNKKMLVQIVFFALVFVVGGILLISSQSSEARGAGSQENIRQCKVGSDIAWSCSNKASCTGYMDCVNPVTGECVYKGIQRSNTCFWIKPRWK